MAINLAATLAWTKANLEEQKMLESLQGNILKGHGRPFTANIFFRLDPNPATQLQSKRMLRHLAYYHLTNAHKQLLDTAPHKNLGPMADLSRISRCPSLPIRPSDLLPVLPTIWISVMG